MWSHAYRNSMLSFSMLESESLPGHQPRTNCSHRLYLILRWTIKGPAGMKTCCCALLATKQSFKSEEKFYTFHKTLSQNWVDTIQTSVSCSVSSACAKDEIGLRGITNTCVGAIGFTSLNAIHYKYKITLSRSQVWGMLKHSTREL